MTSSKLTLTSVFAATVIIFAFATTGLAVKDLHKAQARTAQLEQTFENISKTADTMEEILQ